MTFQVNRIFKLYIQNPDLTWKVTSVATGPNDATSLHYMDVVYTEEIDAGNRVKMVEVVAKLIKTNVPQIPVQPC